jgi:Zn-dependent protease with chaperone function
MNPLLRLAILSATTVVLFGGAAALLASLAYSKVRVRLAALPAEARARWVLAWAALPWLVSAALLALCFVPSFWSLLGLVVDHCPLHDDGHVHLCLAHAPQHPVMPLEWAVLAAAALGVGAVALRALKAQLATWRAVSALLRVAGDDVHAGGLVASAEPLSVTAGLVWPLVLISTGLRNRLAPRHVEAVLAHERAHARRRDPLRLVAVALLGAAYATGTRSLLLSDAALACEEAADEEAAGVVGDRTVVAEAIVAVERLLGERAHQIGLAVGMTGCATEVRVEALLRDPILPSPVASSRRILWGAVVAGALLAASEIHHLTETVLDLIAR